MRRSTYPVCLALFAGTALSEPAEPFSASFQELIGKKNRLTAEQLAAYLPYLYPHERHPVTRSLLGSEEAFRFEVPTEPANQALAAQGYLDVTAAPFSADPAGKRDSTKAIQAAVDFSRDHQMACYFPGGDYLVSDTIVCLQRLTVRANGRISGGDAWPCVLIGAGGPKRARLVLAPRAPGFTDPARRKLVLHVVNCNASSEIKP